MTNLHQMKGHQPSNEKKVKSSWKSLTFKVTHELIAKYLCEENEAIIKEVGDK
jgi:hypothetical protein